ncbi:MAG: hypothetical protein QOD93_6598, partial [Acetobacteraceae bacterium]|nr:hypothetical protein [Acetobacteraceae bacterium]
MSNVESALPVPSPPLDPTPSLDKA